MLTKQHVISMNRIISICIIGLFLLNLSPSSLADNQIEPDNEIKNIKIPIQFSSYEIITSGNENTISVQDFGLIHKLGQPKLPVKIISIAVPPNAEIQKFSYYYSEIVDITGTFNILPVAIPELLNNDQLMKDFQHQYDTNYDQIYTSNAYFPTDNIRLLNRSGYRNFKLVDFEIFPFSYNPISNKLRFIPKMIISIDYQLNEQQENENSLVDKVFEQTASNIIYNFDQSLNWYEFSEISLEDSFDYVIITLDSLTEAIEPLVQWEIEKGRTVNVVTLSFIEGEYHGYDTAEKIRNFLREKYPDDAWSIKDVCIIGHWDDIPMRQTYQSLSTMTDENMPETDYYYAELSLPDNESWDVDQDHKYGENADVIDFYAEVNVGRIPWSDFDTVQHICEKSVAYEQNNNPEFKNNILLLANFIDENTDGATFMEYCVNDTIHPWMNDWMKTRLYERESTYDKDYVINHANVLLAWSQGTYGVVSWNSHGGPYGSGNFIHADDCNLLNDEYPAIISGASCSNSDTNYPNIGQAMLKQGGVGFLGANKATPYRSGWDDPNDGSDQSLKYFFISSITSEEKTQGQAHQYALTEMYERGLWYRLKYETFAHGTLFGNPDLGIGSYEQNNPPEKPEKPDGITSGKINKKHTFSTVSTDIDGDRLYYCWSWGDGEIEWVGPYNTGEECIVTHEWDEEKTYEIKVKARDEFGAESEWSDPLPVSMSKAKIYSLFNYVKENNPFLYNLLTFFSNLN